MVVRLVVRLVVGNGQWTSGLRSRGVAVFVTLELSQNRYIGRPEDWIDENGCEEYDGVWRMELG
jgi:hypothetical protein